MISWRPPLSPTDLLTTRSGQQFRHDVGAGAQVVDGFKERHDAQPAAFAAGVIAEQAAVFGQQIKPQHIGGSAASSTE